MWRVEIEMVYTNGDVRQYCTQFNSKQEADTLFDRMKAIKNQHGFGVVDWKVTTLECTW